MMTAAFQIGTWLANWKLRLEICKHFTLQLHIIGNMSQLEQFMFTLLESSVAPQRVMILYSLTLLRAYLLI